MINQKKFATIALAPKKAFVIYITYLKSKMSINLAYNAQIILLLAKKVSVPKKYTHFLNNFSKKFVVILPDHFNINKYIIDLEPDKQLSYKPVYNLGLVKLKNSKTYIKANLTNRFI